MLGKETHPTAPTSSKLLCQYSGKKDEMRTKVDDLSQDAIDHRMKDIVKIRDKKAGFKVAMPMPENGKITAVSSALDLFPFSVLFPFLPCVLSDILPPCR